MLLFRLRTYELKNVFLHKSVFEVKKKLVSEVKKNEMARTLKFGTLTPLGWSAPHLSIPLI